MTSRIQDDSSHPKFSSSVEENKKKCRDPNKHYISGTFSIVILNHGIPNFYVFLDFFECFQFLHAFRFWKFHESERNSKFRISLYLQVHCYLNIFNISHHFLFLIHIINTYESGATHSSSADSSSS